MTLKSTWLKYLRFMPREVSNIAARLIAHVDFEHSNKVESESIPHMRYTVSTHAARSKSMGHQACVSSTLVLEPLRQLMIDRFLQSSDSRSPLDCSSDMLKSCFTFHQVEASFLDSVYTFGDQDKPLDLCLAHFRSSHTMDLAERDLIAIPELHLSGREFRVSYLLRSMEFSGNTESTWKWNLRQTAVYHSFDAETGKSFWCNIKANDNFKTRIKDSASYLDLDQPALMQEHRVHRLFTAALSTHLIYLHWCDENWRWCINDMDVAIGALLDQARLTSINDLQLTAPAYVELQIRKVTLNSTRTYGNPPPAGLVRDSSRGSAYILHKFAMLLRKVFSPRQLFGRDLGLDLGKSNNLPDPTENPEVAPNRVRVSRPQALQIWSERIERLMLAVQLDITVLGEISAFYSGLTESLVSLHGSVWEEYDRDIRHFAKEIANISSGLETRKVQMQSLVLQLSEGQNLVSLQNKPNRFPLIFCRKIVWYAFTASYGDKR